MKRNISVICYLIIILIISGCGPSVAPTSTPSVAPTSTPTVAPTSTPTETPVPLPTFTPGGTFPVGDYKAVIPVVITEINFLNDGTFRFVLPSEGTVELGTYVVTGDKIVFNENPGNPCTGYLGTYTWSFDGKTMTLKVVEDKCYLPRNSNLSRTWTKQP